MDHIELVRVTSECGAHLGRAVKPTTDARTKVRNFDTVEPHWCLEWNVGYTRTVNVGGVDLDVVSALSKRDA